MRLAVALIQDDLLMQDDHGNRFCGQVVHSITDRTHSERVAPRANLAVQQVLVIVAPGGSDGTPSAS